MPDMSPALWQTALPPALRDEQHKSYSAEQIELLDTPYWTDQALGQDQGVGDQ